MRPGNVPSEILTKLRAYECSRRRVLALRGVAECVMVFCAGIVALALLESVFKPPQGWRVVLSGLAYLASGAWFVYRAGLLLMTRRKLSEVAWDLEKAAGKHFEERIVSAVELAESPPEDQPGVSSWMVARTIQLAEEEIKAADTRTLIDSRPAARAWKQAAACLLGVGAICLVPGVAARLWIALDPSAPTIALSNIQLSVSPGNCRVRQGMPLDIVATGSSLPDQLRTRIRWEDGFQETVAMQRTGTNQFTLNLPSVTQGFRYSVLAADAETSLFSVKVDVLPRIARMQVMIEPPAYAGRTNRWVEGGSAEFLAESRLRLVIETAEEKVASAEWVSDASQVRKFKPENDRLVLDLQPTNPVAYQIKLNGVNGLQSVDTRKWTLRPVPDQPPTARLVAVGAEPGLVQRDEVVPLQAMASDDVGLKKLELVVLAKEAEASQSTLYTVAPGTSLRDYKGPLNYNLAVLDASAGDDVQLQLVATDLRGQVARSEPLSFTIGARDKALEAQAAARLKQLVSSMTAQVDFLQQTRASWLSIARNYREDDPAAQAPALTVLRSRLREFSLEIDNIGRQLIAESETNGLPEARFTYRLGTTVAAWANQQREVLFSNCGQLEKARGTNVYESFALGRELFTRAVLDLEGYRRVMTVLQRAYETDVLATRCESAQSRFKRGLPVLRGDNTVAPLAQGAAATNATLTPSALTALKGRVEHSLSLPAAVPPTLAEMTNDVHNENLERLVREKAPVANTLNSNLVTFAAWTPEQSRESENRADDLTGTAKAASRILREELDKYRWRYEGTAALKEVQNAIEELREITQELRRLPYNARKTRTEQEQAKAQVAATWQKELQRATAEAARRFFETAKDKEATLAQRATALNAAVKTEEQLKPAVARMTEVLAQERNKDELAGGIEQRVNEASNLYRELNQMQEKVEREEIAAQARKALPPARAFARAQQAQDTTAERSRYQAMKPAVGEVVEALRVAGEYSEAQKLEARAGASAEDAKGKETAQQVRELAMRTDNQIPSFAQSIPPPMRRQTEDLEQHRATQEESANALARPRLAMSLESARLARQGDRRTAAAYGLLGQDLGELLETADKLAAATVQPLTDRAAALAGEKGEEARQAEIQAANERLRQLAANDPNNAEVLAGRLEEASLLARQAAGEAPKRQPLASELGEMSRLATPAANWADATDPREVAAGAASESASEIQAAPTKWESYNSASEMLADAARQIRAGEAASDLADLNPYPSLPSPAEAQMQAAADGMEAAGEKEGMSGKAIIQPTPKGLDQAEWARLTERLRQAIRSSGIENFSQEHQAAIRAYFERLSADNQKPTP